MYCRSRNNYRSKFNRGPVAALRLGKYRSKLIFLFIQNLHNTVANGEEKVKNEENKDTIKNSQSSGPKMLQNSRRKSSRRRRRCSSNQFLTSICA